MSGESKLECVKGIFDAFSAFDPEGVADRMTDDVLIRPSAYITGRGEYRGRAELLESFLDLKEQLTSSGQRVRIAPSQYYAEREDENVLLALAHIDIIRETGEKFGTDIAYRFTMEGDRVAAVDAWLDHAEGLSMLDDPVELEP